MYKLIIAILGLIALACLGALLFTDGKEILYAGLCFTSLMGIAGCHDKQLAHERKD